MTRSESTPLKRTRTPFPAPKPLSPTRIAIARAAFTGLLAAAACGATGCVPERDTSANRLAAVAAVPPAAAQLDRTATTTIYPVSLAGHPMSQVGEALGLLLEQRGMSQLELATNTFAAPPGVDIDATAAAFAAFIATTPPTSEYAVYCEFLGTPGRSVDEVRTVVVSRDGTIRWKDRQTARDADFARVAPKEPLTCCVLVADRLQPVFGLTAGATDPNGPEGRLAKRWREANGLPDSVEAAAIETRAEAFRRASSSTTIVVYAPQGSLAAEGERPAEAAALARRVGEEAGLTASAADRTVTLAVPANMNEQRMLWTLARGFSEELRRHPPAADYALMTHSLMAGSPVGGAATVGAVHTVLCDRTGAIVLVDFRNSHHADFEAARLRTAADRASFVARRVAEARK